MRRLFRRWVLARPWLSFDVMGLGFLIFGSCTIDLIRLFQANAAFIAKFGWMAIMDGGLLQLAELLLTGAVAMVAYIVFKACEARLARWVAEER